MQVSADREIFLYSFYFLANKVNRLEELQQDRYFPWRYIENIILY